MSFVTEDRCRARPHVARYRLMRDSIFMFKSLSVQCARLACDNVPEAVSVVILSLFPETSQLGTCNGV